MSDLLKGYKGRILKSDAEFLARAFFKYHEIERCTRRRFMLCSENSKKKYAAYLLMQAQAELICSKYADVKSLFDIIISKAKIKTLQRCLEPQLK